MAATPTCPSRVDYVRLLSGQTPPDAVAQLAAHVEDCAGCQETVRSLLAGEATRGSLRSRASSPAGADRPGLEELVGRLLMKGNPTSSLAGRPDEETRPSGDSVSAEVPQPYPFLAPPQAADELGRLGEHRVVRVLGEGGMGIVFEAEDLQLRRRVALKAMKPALAARPQARQRFLREARLVAALEHDHVVAIHRVEEDGGIPYLTMPLLKGESLDRRLSRDGALPPAEAVRIGRDVAAALSAAHARKIVHRDVKPSNVWLESGSGRVKVLDFGLARLTEGEPALSDPHTVVGTPAYMAPEQVRGEAIDGRTDLFALGCLLYRMSTGKSPFQRADVPATLLAVTNEEPPPPAAVNPAVPAVLSALIMSLLRKAPGDRPATADAVLEALRRVEAQGHAVPPPPAVPVAAVPEPSPRRGGRRRTAVVALLLLAAAATLAGGVLIIRHRDGRVERIQLQDGDVVELTAAKPAAAADPAAKAADDVRPPAAAAARPIPAVGNPDRRAAEWTLSLGGTVTVSVGTQVRYEIRELPSAEFKLLEVDLRGIQVDDAGLAHFEGLTSITGISLSGAPVTDAGLAHLERLSNLNFLRLSQTAITDAGLVHLKGLKNLQTLHVWLTKVSGDGFVHLQGLPHLERLYFTPTSAGALKNLLSLNSLQLVDIADSPIGDAVLAELRGMSGLRSLHAHHTTVTDAGLRHVRALPALTDLNLWATPVTAAGMEHVSALKNLVSLNLSETKVTGADLARLGGLQKLQYLMLNNVRVSDADLQNLVAFPDLALLTLKDTATGDAGLAQVKRAAKLQQLDLTNTRVGDAGMADVNALTNLKELVLNGTAVSDAGVARLDALARLTRLELSDTRVTDASIRTLVNCFPGLKSLNVSGARVSARGSAVLKAAFPDATVQWSEPNRAAAEAVLAAGGTVRFRTDGAAADRAARAAGDLPEDSFRLTAVGLAGLSTLPAGLAEKLAALRDPEFDGLAAVDCEGARLTAADLTALARAVPRSVVELSLAHTRSGDALLTQVVKDLARLRKLDLTGAPVVGPGVAALKALPELTELKLGCPTLTDAFAPELAGLAALKHLERLSLAGSGVGDKSLQPLGGLTNLRELDLTGTRVTAEGIATLRKALPACKIRGGNASKG